MLPQCASALVATSMMIGSALATVAIPVRPDGKNHGPAIERQDSSEPTEVQRRLQVERALAQNDMIAFYDAATMDEIATYLERPEDADATFQPAATSNPVRIHVDVARNLMTVQDGAKTHTYRVATGRTGHQTLKGQQFSIRADPKMIGHRSSIYGAPMPYSMHYSWPFAIHGTYERRSIGRHASHGCIRMNMEDIKAVFGMVGRAGGGVVTVE